MINKSSPAMLTAMRGVMQSHVAHIMFCEIIKEANHTPPDTLHDYRIAATMLFRDEVIGIIASAMTELLAPEHKDDKKLLAYLFVFAEMALEEMSKSNARFKNLFDHLRQEHKAEITAACAEVGFTGEWKD